MVAAEQNPLKAKYCNQIGERFQNCRVEQLPLGSVVIEMQRHRRGCCNLSGLVHRQRGNRAR